MTLHGGAGYRPHLSRAIVFVFVFVFVSFCTMSTGDPVNASDKRLCATYLFIALAALVGTWSQNLMFMAEPGHDSALAFIEACFANRAATSITIDLLLLGVSAFVFMGVETKRLDIRFYWLYVGASFLIAISVVFPLFMIARQRRIAALRAAPGLDQPSAEAVGAGA